MTEVPTVPGAPTAGHVPDYPMPRESRCPLDPPPALRELARKAPLTQVRWWDGTTPWVVTGYAEQRALLSDPRLSADASHPNHPARAAALKEIQADNGRSFVRMDDPEHGRLRRMITGWFSVKKAEALRPAIQRIVDSLIDDILAGPKPTDLVSSFAAALPSYVICDLLGVPYSDHHFFQEKVAITTGFDTTPDQGAEANAAMLNYMDDLCRQRLARPGDDLMSELAARVMAGELTQLGAAQMGVLLLIGGHDTTANMIALGTLALLEHPEQMVMLRKTGDRAVVANAVEELLRYLTIVDKGQPRAALEDIEVGGRVIHANDGVLLACEMANRDPSVYPDPEQLDIGRDARGHLAFGFGVHQCVGQNLARVELQVAYDVLYKRMPTMRLATSLDKIRFKHDAIIYGVYELPITW